ncbi:hypothetical protein QTJ16_001464 [Diplocarpon rosae]|uniref:Myb-like domain-containing protein n=1 Tax=Diplocarpon rosae TaxID=946125 RepID=A0AAD9T826_9HELO|nr:hypothetical protein QTJ16_001464 [Diplocarpon rosae]PBP22344.1 hypothetical protein BUE80_DR006915 [Diplocarpon rosae]
MADGKKGAWSEGENYSLVYQIVQQLLGASKVSIKFDTIVIPGRTSRALSERWSKIKNDVNAAGIANSGAPAAPRSIAPRTPGSGKQTKDAGSGSKTATPASKRKAVSGGAEEDNTATPTPKRRKSPLKKKKKKEMVEDEDEVAAEESEEMPVLTDSSGSDGMISSPTDSYRSYEH